MNGKESRLKVLDKLKANKKSVLIFGIIIAILLVLGGTIFGMSLYTQKHFVKGTVINGIDVSGMSIDELKDKIGDYSLRVIQRKIDPTSRKISTYQGEISGEKIYLQVGDDKALESIIRNQSFVQCIIGGGVEKNLGDSLVYNANHLEYEITHMWGFDEKNVVKAKDACLSQYINGVGYQVEKEESGNEMDLSKVRSQVVDAISNLKEEIDLNQLDCYVKPSVTSQDAKLQKSAKLLNNCVNAEITYEFGKDTVVLDGNFISQWVTLKGNKVKLDKDKIANYVAILHRNYDTATDKHKFVTAAGDKVTVQGGDYGWLIDQEKEAKILYKLIMNGVKKTRKPAYLREAKGFGDEEFGKLYVEVNLTKQHVYVMKKGKIVFDTPCVTGNQAQGHSTPSGCYTVTYTSRNAVLRGPGYASPVSYWMPFNGGIGLHDATWRGSFGGSIYRYSGSHGCVNLPLSSAAKIFGMVKQGTPVICYYSKKVPKSGKKAKEQKKKKVETKKDKVEKKIEKKSDTKKSDKKHSLKKSDKKVKIKNKNNRNKKNKKNKNNRR